jgi:hypothetical protein
LHLIVQVFLAELTNAETLEPNEMEIMEVEATDDKDNGHISGADAVVMDQMDV